jgi:hypothetical protein
MAMATNVMRSKEVCEKWMDAMFAARKSYETAKETEKSKLEDYLKARREYMAWIGPFEHENELINLLHFHSNAYMAATKRCERLLSQFKRVKDTYVRTHVELVACVGY